MQEIIIIIGCRQGVNQRDEIITHTCPSGARIFLRIYYYYRILCVVRMARKEVEKFISQSVSQARIYSSQVMKI